ncbi:amidohydrolase family protein [Bradyrhizobium sp. 44]|jgi:8-oxoguanine deaminase|uniref:amidohydrolase family protein n=1 Tax=Bradyrhizobium sp. 44 TaxID=2782675 RepID=UPI001FFB4592|nr:amidohydrolase family protein [Bradyrhizobium sp. 44]MCK1284285.1 amidohydrolase family protein [Bradyrhizobium sp. 44]
MRRLIENIDTLHTCDDEGRVLRRAWIVVAGSRIAALGDGPPPAGDFDERIDLSSSVAMPGLVNAHHHFFQTLTRALPRAQRGHLLDWLSVLYPVWGLMQPEDLAAVASASAAELLLTGATTTVDHFYLVPRCEDAYLETEVEALGRMGIRLHLVRGSMTTIESDLEARLSITLGPRAGGIIDDPAPVLASMRRAVERWHDASAGSMLTVALGPTTPTWGDPDFMRAVAQLSDELAVGIHMHVHPQSTDRMLCRDQFEKGPVDWLDSLGMLGPRTWFAHATRMNDSEIALLGERGVGVAHCPRMIMRLGARIPYIHRMRAAGMPVGIGVDGAASNDSGSMLNELRLALLLHRLADGGGEVAPEFWMTPQDVLGMATRTGAALIGRSDIGAIAPGMQADITAFDMRGVGFAGARADLLSGLLLAGDNTMSSLTMVGGTPLVVDGKLLRQDEEALRAAADRAAERVIERAARLTGIDYLAFTDGRT